MTVKNVRDDLPSPKYEIVKKQLLDFIESESLTPNDKIPSENEIAKRYGVSVITARKALSDLVNDGFIYRIKGKGSFVSISRNQNTKQKLRVITFLLPVNESGDGAFINMIRGIQSRCSALGYHILLEVSNDEIETEQNLIDKSIKDNVSGLIIYSLDPEKSISQFVKLKDAGIPFVLIDRYTEQQPFHIVSSYNVAGAFTATKHLIDLGHEKILFAAHKCEIKTEQMRRHGYELALRASNIKPDSSLFFDHSIENAEMIYDKVRNGEVTAIVCSNDYCALKLMEHLAHRGLSIPKDVSIIGFDGIRLTELVTPPLTTVVQSFYEMGVAAGNMLMKALEQDSLDASCIFIPVHLEVRGSSAPPKKFEK